MSLLFVLGILTNSAAVLDCAVCSIHDIYFEEIGVLRACIRTEHISME